MTLAARIKDNKAIYTGAGAVDLAVEKLREMPDAVARVRAELTENYGRYRGVVSENVADVRGEVNQRVTKARNTLTLRVNEVRANVAKYQGKAENATLQDYVSTMTAKMNEVIEDLAERGRTVINKAAGEVEAEAREVKSPEPKPAAKPRAATRRPATTRTATTRSSTARSSTAKKAD